MTLYSFATLEPSPSPEETLAVFARALDGRSVAAARRIMASDDSRSPDEGLALLEAYVGIAEKGTRQAILDAVIAIADTDPYKRARSRGARRSHRQGAHGPTAPRSNDR